MPKVTIKPHPELKGGWVPGNPRSSRGKQYGYRQPSHYEAFLDGVKVASLHQHRGAWIIEWVGQIGRESVWSGYWNGEHKTGFQIACLTIREQAAKRSA